MCLCAPKRRYLNKGYSNNIKNLSLFKLPKPEKPTLDQIQVKKLFLQLMVTTQRSVLPDKHIYKVILFSHTSLLQVH